MYVFAHLSSEVDNHLLCNKNTLLLKQIVLHFDCVCGENKTSVVHFQLAHLVTVDYYSGSLYEYNNCSVIKLLN